MNNQNKNMMGSVCLSDDADNDTFWSRYMCKCIGIVTPSNNKIDNTIGPYFGYREIRFVQLLLDDSRCSRGSRLTYFV